MGHPLRTFALGVYAVPGQARALEHAAAGIAVVPNPSVETLYVLVALWRECQGGFTRCS